MIEITIKEDIASNILAIFINDNGCGMEKEFLDDVVNPFRTTRSTRKVGLGLSLLKNACELAGGNLEITSKVNVGTRVKATFLHNSIDRQPIGDMATTISAIIGSNDKIDYVFTHLFNDNEYVFSTREIRAVLGDEIDLSIPDVLTWIEDYISNQEEILYGGAKQ